MLLYLDNVESHNITRAALYLVQERTVTVNICVWERLWSFAQVIFLLQRMKRWLLHMECSVREGSNRKYKHALRHKYEEEIVYW